MHFVYLLLIKKLKNFKKDNDRCGKNRQKIQRFFILNRPKNKNVITKFYMVWFYSYLKNDAKFG